MSVAHWPVLPETIGPCVYMGGDQDESYADGCPGGWYRCVFLDSVLRYGEHGLRLSGDELLAEAVDYYRHEQRRCLDADRQ